MKKIELKNRGVILGLSITISILLWSYVMGDINPRINRNFSSVAVEVTGDETGEFILRTEEDLSVDVSISGRRNDIYRIRRDDMNFTLDINGYEEGTHIIPIEHSIKMDSSDIDLDYSPRELEVTLENIISKDFNVELDITEGFLSEIPKDRIKTEEKTITITGGRSLVESVDKLVATLDTTDIVGEGNIELDIVPIDTEGSVVEEVELSENTLSLSILPESNKIMTIEANLEGEVGEGYKIVSTEISPNTIEASGEVDDIDTIRTETIDITGITEDSEYEVDILLPEGVETDFNESVSVKLELELIQENEDNEDNEDEENNIGDKEERTISYSASDISVMNLEEDLSLEFQDENQDISVKISSDREYLEGFDKDELNLTLDLADITEAGTYDMDIDVSNNSENIDILSVIPETLELIVTEN